MAETRIPPMKAPVYTLPRDAKDSASRSNPSSRDQRMSRVIQARRRLEGFVKDDKSFAPHPPRGSGRAWINGREVGGDDSRYGHLSASYD